MSASPDAVRAAGTFVQPVTVHQGTYALRFDMPASDQYLKTINSVQLKPNTTYSLSAMFYNMNYRNNPDVSDVNLYVKLEGTSIEATQKGITWRGFQYRNVIFATGANPETYFIVAGIAGAEIPTAPVFIDDIRIQRHSIHGVAVGIASWQGASFPDITRFGSANGCSISNG